VVAPDVPERFVRRVGTRACIAIAVAAALLCACGRVGFGEHDLAGDAAPSGDAGRRDSGPRVSDAGAPNSGPPREDAGTAPSDAGTGVSDSGSPDAGPMDSGAMMVSCPPDMYLAFGGRPFCIDVGQNADMPHADAQDTCSARGQHLCTEAEFVAACPTGGLTASLDSWEWTLEIVVPGEGRKRLLSDCTASSQAGVDAALPFRCCVDR
jgi:hypothetical protein